MSDKPEEKDDAETVAERLEDKLVRPTLYVGLGGTGAAILTALRRRILQRQWNGHRLESLDDFKVASFLYFDTYAGPAKDEEARKAENDQEDPIAPLVALQKADSIQAGLDPAKYLKRDPVRGTAELDSYPYVKSWLPAEELSTINLEEGAGQIRAMSRLLLFDRIVDIHSQIGAKVRQLRDNLTDRDLLTRYGLRTTNKVNVKIIASAAGGTGSGAFIDAGLLARSLKDPEPDEVSLWLVLGGAFAGQGPRVSANTYAALAELEYALKTRYGVNKFVDTWDGKLQPPADGRPFSRLYLFDSSNTAGVGVNQQGRDYVFRMIADVLMQEMAEPDLVGKRRGDQSNQDTKYREPMYAPVVTRQYQNQGLEYSRLYSAIGQSTVETRARIEFQAQGAEAAIGMLRAYFRIDGSQTIAPKPTAVEEFLNEKLFLGPARQFTVHKELRSPPVLSDYPLVFSRLLAKDGGSLLESIQNDLATDYQRLIESPMGEWPTRAMDVKRQRRSEIEQEAAEKDKAGLTLRARGVDDSYRRLNIEITAPDGPLRRGILGLIDSDIGGIAYAEQFVYALKARLAGYWIPLFRRDSDTFGDLAGKVMSKLYDQAAENLQKVSKGTIISKPNRPQMETILNQMKETLTTWMQYRMRQIACTRAADLLESVDAALGDSAGAAAGGKPQFTGILRDIHDGMSTVEDAISDLEREAKLIRDPDTAHNPIHQVIGSPSSAPMLTIDAETYRNLAKVAFESYGGATNLFNDLRSRRKRAEVLNRIRRVASEESGPGGKPILPREAEVPSLLVELDALGRNKSEDVIAQAVKQAMPWININKRAIDTAWSEDMNSVFVCVNDRDGFKAKFDTMVRKAVSSHIDAVKEVNYVESESLGRLAICTELTGLPLDALVQLHDEWYRQYENLREDGKQAPLHTHKEWEKFARPTAPDAAEMRRRLDDLGLFIQGVGLGILRRRVASRSQSAPDRVGQYEINLSAGMTNSNWVPVGKELKIRNFGLKNDHHAALSREVQKLSTEFNAWQMLAVAVLFEHYAQYHYVPRLDQKDGSLHAGLGHLAADTLVNTFRRSFEDSNEGRECFGRDSDYVSKRAKVLLGKIDEWTSEIEGSLDDVDGMEADKSASDPERRARPKRVVKMDVFCNEDALRRLIEGDGSAKSSSPRLFWYVGPDGKASSSLVDGATILRLAAEGTITSSTKLCARDEKLWRPADSWPEFAGKFEAPPPIGADDGPPPLS